MPEKIDVTFQLRVIYGEERRVTKDRYGPNEKLRVIFLM
jgi:hypothetical protein